MTVNIVVVEGRTTIDSLVQTLEYAKRRGEVGGMIVTRLLRVASDQVEIIFQEDQ